MHPYSLFIFLTQVRKPFKLLFCLFDHLPAANIRNCLPDQNPYKLPQLFHNAILLTSRSKSAAGRVPRPLLLRTHYTVTRNF